MVYDGNYLMDLTNYLVHQIYLCGIHAWLAKGKYRNAAGETEAGDARTAVADAGCPGYVSGWPQLGLTSGERVAFLASTLGGSVACRDAAAVDWFPHRHT